MKEKSTARLNWSCFCVHHNGLFISYACIFVDSWRRSYSYKIKHLRLLSLQLNYRRVLPAYSATW